MSRKLGVCIGCGAGDYYIKASWKIYREYTVFASEVDDEQKQIFHIKRLWERSPVLEVLGLHLTYLLDPELGPSNYLFGQYLSGRWFWKKPTYYILTTWIEGSPLPKPFKKSFEMDSEEDTKRVRHLMGRHFVLHRFLSLYDVDIRHFLFTPWKGLKRIDYGLSFLHMDYPAYSGFEIYFGEDARLFELPEFQAGMREEREHLAKTLRNHKEDIQHTIQFIVGLDSRDPEILLKTDIFGKYLQSYWEREVDYAPVGEWIAEILR